MKIALDQSDPLIWRTILVRKSVSFFELHHSIQVVMGWKNAHLFEFNIHGYRIGEIAEEFQVEGFGSDELLDCRILTLDDMISEHEAPFQYIYDFGDYWKHTLMIEKSLPEASDLTYPVCLDGQLRCPPEDCGGIYGYYNNLSILKDRRHEEYRDVKRWMGPSFDPNAFDKDAVNRKLKNLKRYMSK